MLKQDLQAEYILKHLEDYYSSTSEIVVAGNDDHLSEEVAVDEIAAATREGARLVIERALVELARLA